VEGATVTVTAGVADDPAVATASAADATRTARISRIASVAAAAGRRLRELVPLRTLP
jgi:hypothetical protein